VTNCCKRPITAGPEIKYIKKERKEKENKTPYIQYIIGKSRNPMQLYFKQMVLKV